MKNKFLYIILLFITTSYMFSQTCSTGNCYEPIANPGIDRTYFQGVEIMLDGSDSFDPDNSDCILTYDWISPNIIELIDGEDPSSPSFIAPLIDDLHLDGCSNPDYVTPENCVAAFEIWVNEDDGIADIPIRLTVNDGEYNSLNDAQVVISIVKINTPPVLGDIEFNYTINRLSEFTIDASSASDENSLTGNLDFIWEYNDFADFGGEIIDDSIESIRVFKSPNISDVYTITLTISDGYDSIESEFIINVQSAIPPISVPGKNLSVAITEEVTLDATRSFDEDGEISNYTWNYDDCIINYDFEEVSIQENGGIVILKAPEIAGQTCRVILTVEDNDAEANESKEWAGKNLFISEYAEARQSNNSYLEIYNGTDSVVDLSEYSIKITQSNGNEYDLNLNDTSDDSINNGTLGPGDILLIVKTDAGQLCSPGAPFLNCIANNVQFIEWASINKFNGDDAVTLYHNGELIDVIGTPGGDPGAGWDVGGVEEATKNHTMIRRDYVLSGNLDWEISSGNHSETIYFDEATCIADEGLWIEEYDETLDISTFYCNISEWEILREDTFSYGGENTHSACDNYIDITTIANTYPTQLTIIDVPDIEDLTIKKDNTPTTLVLQASAYDREGVELNYVWEPAFTDITLSESEIRTSDGYCVDKQGNIENIQCGICEYDVDENGTIDGSVCGDFDVDDIDGDGSTIDLIETGCCNLEIKKTTSTAVFSYPASFIEIEDEVNIQCSVDDGVNLASEGFCSDLNYITEANCSSNGEDWIDTIASISFDINPENEEPQIHCEIKEKCAGCDWLPISDPSNINECQGNCENDNSCEPCQYSTTESTLIEVDCSYSFDSTSTGELVYVWSTPYIDADGDGGNDIVASNLQYNIFPGDLLTLTMPAFISENRTFPLKVTLSDGDNVLDVVEESFSFTVIAENPIVENAFQTGYVFDSNDYTTPLGICSNPEYTNNLEDCLTDPNAIDEDGDGEIDVYPGIWGECSDNTYTDLSSCLYIDGISDQNDPNYKGPTGEQWGPYPSYEGSLIEIKGSAMDPNGNCSDPSATTQSSCIGLGICAGGDSSGNEENVIECDEVSGTWTSTPGTWTEDPLTYDWDFTPDETNTGTFYGVCLDIDGMAIDRSPCSDDGDCANTCSYDSYITYLKPPIHLQKDTDIEIEFETTDIDGNESEEDAIIYTVTAIAKYPVAHAGYDFEAVVGSDVSLMGYLSYDNQENEVTLGSWDTSPKTSDAWEESGRRIIAYYSNYLLEPLANYVFTWNQTSGTGVAMDLNAVNPVFTAPDNPETLEFELQITDPDGHISEVATVVIDIIDDTEPVVRTVPDFRAAGSNVIDGVPSIITLDAFGYCSDSQYGRPLDCIYKSGCGDKPALGPLYSGFEENEDGVLEFVDNIEDCADEWLGTYDLTPHGTLSYQWTSNPCSDGVSETEQECCENNQGTFHQGVCYPCSLIDHDNPGDCQQNDGNWADVIEDWTDNIIIINDDNIKAKFEAPEVSHGQEIRLSFTLDVVNTIDGIENSYTDNLIITIARPSTPISPSLDAKPDHGQILLSWDSDPEKEGIDSLTHYADFQGYRIYKSTDYGQTWGKEEDMLLSEDGEFLGWKPYQIIDYNEENDINYCLYTPSNINSNGETCNGQEGREIRGEDGDVSGFDPYQLWFDMGSNVGLVNTFIDTNVIDGIDYTYTITAYDRGLKPINAEVGSYDDIEGVWTTDEDHTFTEKIPAKEYILNRLNYTIKKSEIIGNVYNYIVDTPDGIQENQGFAQIKDMWPTSNPDRYYIGIDDNGVKQGYQSLESPIGSSESDHNYVTARGGFYASDIEFPDNDDIGNFISSDCRAVGNGTKKYQVVNVDEMSELLIKFEIQATSMGDVDADDEEDGDGNPIPGYGFLDPVTTFEGHPTESPCLFAFPVIPVIEDNARLRYAPTYHIDCSAISDVDICGNEKGCAWEKNTCSNIAKAYQPMKYNGDDYFIDLIDIHGHANGILDTHNNENIANYEGLPGVDIIYSSNPLAADLCDEYSYCLGYYYDNKVQCEAAPDGEWKTSRDCILIPEYLKGMGGFADDCFSILPSDDPYFEENFTEKIDGARFRFDNAISVEPPSKIAALDVASSSHVNPETPDNYLLDEILSDDFNGGSIELRFYNSFNKKPCYDYEIELGSNGLSEAIEPGSACPNDGFTGTQLPFRIKNKTTGKYVTVKHNDGGIFDGNPPPLWQGPVPGANDCMWQPGEALFFQQDSVKIGYEGIPGYEENIEWSSEKTYELFIDYQIDQLVYSGYNLCDGYDYNYSDAENYTVGDCVYHEGMLWRATEGVEDSSYQPNEWVYNELTDKNDNPWTPVYPWDSGDMITLNTVKNYVDGDYWIADMSMLGKVTTEDKLSSDTREWSAENIKVVPNPYMVYSNQTGNTLRFIHLPRKCTITIYTVSGEFVDIIEHDTELDGEHTWDLKNKHGYDVAPGLYIYQIQILDFYDGDYKNYNEEELKDSIYKTGKFAIVK